MKFSVMLVKLTTVRDVQIIQIVILIDSCLVEMSTKCVIFQSFRDLDSDALEALSHVAQLIIV